MCPSLRRWTHTYMYVPILKSKAIYITRRNRHPPLLWILFFPSPTQSQTLSTSSTWPMALAHTSPKHHPTFSNKQTTFGNQKKPTTTTADHTEAQTQPPTIQLLRKRKRKRINWTLKALYHNGPQSKSTPSQF